jgi:DNA-binding transcriptional ArsR family regulator
MVQSVQEVDAQAILLKGIEENPGIRYRELLRLSGFVNGVLSYHLLALERANVIKVNRESRMTRYFPLSVSDKESTILKFVRHEPVRKTLLLILEHDMCTFNEIVDHTGKAPSTVSLHLKRLREAGIILIRHGEYHQLYRVVERDLVAEVFSKYTTSFMDKVIDNYNEMLEEL